MAAEKESHLIRQPEQPREKGSLRRWLKAGKKKVQWRREPSGGAAQNFKS